MPAFIEIEIEHSHYTSTGARYRVTHGGEVLLKSSRDPTFEAARALWAAGADADDLIITRYVNFHPPHETPTVAGRVAALAALTTTEGQSTSVRIIRWVPYTGPTKDDDDG